MMRWIGIVVSCLAVLWLGSCALLMVRAAIWAQGPMPTFQGAYTPRERLTFDIDTTRPTETSASPGSRFPRRYGEPDNACRLPSAGEAQIVSFGVYEGDATSTVALGDRDEETTVVDIEIEPGPGKLYLVLSSFEANVWRLTGSVGRVERVVLIGDDGRPDPPVIRSRGEIPIQPTMPRQPPHRSSPQGVTGIDADRVTTVNGCFRPDYNPGSIASAMARATIRNGAGRDPMLMAGHYSLAVVRLPSGMGAQGTRNHPTPDGFDRGLWEEALRFQPGGLTHIDADQVVSAVPVLDYDVLPQEFGLSQLVGSGRLMHVADGFRIGHPIPRFPAGLNGAHSVTFLLGTGVPMPDGEPGHSCVISEATGRPAGEGRTC